MLCALCISMFQGLTENTEGAHHASFEHLTMAANSGCRICKGLCRFRDKYGPDHIGELCTDPFLRFRFFHNSDMCPRIWFYSKATWLAENALPAREIQLHVSDPTAAPDWWSKCLKKAEANLLDEPWRVQEDGHSHRYIPSNTGDPEVLKLALEWLTSCESNHETCGKIEQSPTTKRYYPPRLLNIAPASADVYHLLINEDASFDGTGYVTLSHCWGENPSFLTLTSENVADLQHGVLSSSLPKSFVDSIQISRKLGFRYIWIDSLCVIQSGPGSDADWQIHSATMDLIYANCDLNVAVTCAGNAHRGAFVERDPDFLQPAYVYVPLSVDLRHGEDAFSSDASSDSTVTSGQHTSTDEEHTIDDEDMGVAETLQLVTVFMGIYDFQSSLWDLPLQKRGWVVQERLMAPRVIHFGKDRIYWECKERFLNEHLPWGIPSSGELFDEHYQKKFSLPYVVTDLAEEPLVEEIVASLHLAWHSMIDNYSDTNLTFPNKDKLAAVAALATRYGRVLQSPYEAGLFQSDLPLGLLWDQSIPSLHRTCTGNQRTWEEGWQEDVSPDSRRNPNYRAPSWYVFLRARSVVIQTKTSFKELGKR